jgi:hypothetical protein
MPLKKTDDKATEYKSPFDDELVKERNRINSVRTSLEVLINAIYYKGIRKSLEREHRWEKAFYKSVEYV